MIQFTISSSLLHKTLTLLFFSLLQISIQTISIPNIDLSSTSLDPTTTGYTITEGTANDRLGWSVSTAGDIDNDGYSDVVIGAYYGGNDYGAIYVIYGGPESSFSDISLSSTLDPATTGFMVTGNAVNDRFGCSVSTAGDINNDGYDDIIIGAAGKNSYQGSAYVIYGGERSSFQNLDLSSTTLDPSTTGFTMIGSATADYFGNSVSTAGDVNGDGFDDIIIGAYYQNYGQGAIYVIYGASKSSLPDLDLSSDTFNGFAVTGSSSSDLFGYSVSTAGDMDNDGYDDIIVGARGKSSSRGAAFIIYGGTSLSSFSLETIALVSSSTGFMILGSAAGDYFGFSVSTAGDVNGDGHSDVLVGADYYGENSQGAAYVVYGGERSSLQDLDLSTETLDPSTNGFTMIGGSSAEILGYSVNTAGDINNDGYSDLLIGGQGRNTYQGILYVVYGAPTASLQDFDFSSATLDPDSTGFTVIGNAQNDHFAFSVSTAGDINNDGYDDIIIGAQAKGVVYVIHSACLQDNCKSCVRTCQECDAGYYLTDSECDACPENCDECSDASTCTSCTSPYLLYESGCLSTCPDETFTLNDECIDCPEYCETCTSLESCDTCDDGYAISESLCAACPANCAECSTISTCDECTSPYLLYQSAQCLSTCDGARYVLDSDCLDCPSSCSSCISEISCQTCHTEYYLTDLAQCDACPNNCNECSDASICIQCTSPYLLYESACISTCHDATFTSSDQCIDCPENCASCTSLTSCQTCDEKYTISDSLCAACPSNCDECSDPSTCTQCTSPYLLYQSQCISICPSATFTSNGQCIDCPEYCAICSSLTTCKTCDQGYTLTDSSLCSLSSSALSAALKTEAKVSSTASSAASGLGSLLCFGSSTFPINTLISKTVQNTRYINISVTDQLTEAFETWGTEMIEWDLPDVFSRLDHFNSLPSVFEQYSLDSPFLVNFWSSLMTITVGIGTLLTCGLLKKLLFKQPSWIHSLLEKLTIGSINFTIAQAYGCLDDILFYSVLDLKTNPFNTFFAWASFFSALGFIVLGVLLILFNIIMVKKYQKVKKECVAAGNSLSDLETFNIKNKYWEVFYSDFSDNDSWSHCFLALLIVRNSVSSLIIATLYGSRLTQATSLLMIDGAIIIFLMSKKPFLTVRAAVIQYFYETITVLVHLCVFILCIQDNETTLKDVVCTSVIYLNTILVASGVGFMLFEIYLNLREILKAWKAKRNQKKSVNPITLETSAAQEILSTTQPAILEPNPPIYNKRRVLRVNKQRANRSPASAAGFYLPSRFQGNNHRYRQNNDMSDSMRGNLQHFQSLDENNSSLSPGVQTSHLIDQLKDQSFQPVVSQNTSRVIKRVKRKNRYPIDMNMM